MTSRIGIIGCGWLGKALAKQLQQLNFDVLTTVRSIEKQPLIVADNIACELLNVPGDVNEKHAIFQQDVLIITITPGFKQKRTDYAENIAKLVFAAEKSSVKQVILISSTGIYQGMSGLVNEQTVIDSSDQKSTLLLAAEQVVLNFNGNGQILRLSGLVGEDRKPGKFLAGKTGLIGASNKVNLIHKNDAVGLIIKLIEQNKVVPHEQKIFIGVSKTLASKKDFYQLAAQSMSLAPPEFSLDKQDNDDRDVNGDLTRQLLDYQYQQDDLVAWLKSIS